MTCRSPDEAEDAVETPGARTTYVDNPDQALHEIRIRVVAHEIPKVADIVMPALVAGLERFGSRSAFAGDVRVIIPVNSPEAVRAQLPGLREVLGGAALASAAMHGRTLNIRVEEEGRLLGAGKPILPCLKEAAWPGSRSSVCRPLWSGEKLASMPWVAYGYDEPHTFAFLSRADFEKLQKTQPAVEREAIENLGKRRAAWQAVEVKMGFFKRLQMLVCGDDFLAAERILDHLFLMRGHATLRAPVLAVGVPRRGVIMATNFDQAKDKLAAFAAAVVGQYRRGESAPICPNLLVVKDGKIVGAVDASVPAPPQPAEEDTDGSDVTTIVARNDAGGHGLHILIGGDDFDRLSRDAVNALADGLSKHGSTPGFSGLVKVVILAHTPEHVTKELPRLEAHLRAVAAEARLPKLELRLEQQAG